MRSPPGISTPALPHSTCSRWSCLLTRGARPLPAVVEAITDAENASILIPPFPPPATPPPPPFAEGAFLPRHESRCSVVVLIKKASRFEEEADPFVLFAERG